ncbi:hypothetical protein NDU88_001043 [Pleurodeles waltl]|uniref:Uncharacterized protein n=1 Tax=Pleurodeles waltl TaxID=8319 RepID=A0AAV7P5H6_PLEWA|nr:hypothetical protein NDU88_001043 [Pleurodeles waltl]
MKATLGPWLVPLSLRGSPGQERVLGFLSVLEMRPGDVLFSPPRLGVQVYLPPPRRRLSNGSVTTPGPHRSSATNMSRWLSRRSRGGLGSALTCDAAPRALTLFV